MEKIVLGTSLAPFDFEKQIIAVESWIKNGFRVISCNTKEEIDVLKSRFGDLEIEFEEVVRDAHRIVGKPLPYIQDILDIVSSQSKHICGYINSDIIISDMPDGMYEFLAEEADNSLVFIRRNEIGCVDDIKSLNWKIHFDGIDLFFVDKRLVFDFFDDGFFVQSVWDLSILVKCELLKINIKELMNPIAFHIRHTLKWDYETSLFLVEKFYRKYFGEQHNMYKKALDSFYNIIFEKCIQICFYKSQNYRCLFIVGTNDGNTMMSIENQDYDNIDVASSEPQIWNNDKYEYIFYIKKGVILCKIFCRTVMYIMEQFDCKKMEIGRFFVSLIENKNKYNELNRNIDIIEQLNEENQIRTVILRQGKGVRDGLLYHPISYERLNIEDNNMIDYRKLRGKAFLMPAGIRASEWYSVNKDSLCELQIMGFFDNSIEKIGMEIFGMPIYSLIELEENAEAYVIVASKRYSRQIETQLSTVISKEKIINASQIIHVDNKGGIYFFNCEKYKQEDGCLRIDGGGGKTL